MLSLLTGEQLRTSLYERFLDMQELVNTYREKNRSSNQKLLEEILSQINADMTEWDASLCRRFILTYCAIARDDLVRKIESSISSMDDDVVQTMKKQAQERADWICSFSALLNTKSNDMAKLQVCGLWTMSRLFTSDTNDDLGAFAMESSTCLAPVGAPINDMMDQIRAQIVIHVSNQVKNGMSDENRIETAKAWCQELLNSPQVRNLIIGVGAPRNLNVTIPTQDDSPISEQPTIVKSRGDEGPRIWRVPEMLPSKDRDREFQMCFIRLRALSLQQGSPLSEFAEQLRDIMQSSSLNQASPILYNVARQLWRAFCSNGDKSTLELAQNTSWHLFCLNTIQDDEYNKTRALHLWMNTQLPILIKNSDLDSIFDDARKLTAMLKARPAEHTLKEGIIEAHAGVVQQLTGEGDKESKEQLLRDNGIKLRQIHDEYIRRTSGNPNVEELSAWEYLFGQEPALKPPVQSHSLLADLTFKEVINSGSHENSYLFIQKNLSRVKDLLIRRMDVRLSREHVIEPMGSTFRQGSQKKYEIHPIFAAARRELQNGDYANAIPLLESLSGKPDVQQKGREVCLNFLAYALARSNNSVPARRILSDLTKSKIDSAAAYWNFACCLPEEIEHRPIRLDALADGIKNAPHPKILHGAIYLAILLEDHDHLRMWLPMLASIESLALSFYYEYDKMNFDKRDSLISRMIDYWKKGEPVIPDPLEDPNELRGDKGRAYRDHIDQFLQNFGKQQTPVFEFWLQCREPIAKHRYEYWEIKVNFLNKVERRDEAVRAFKDEIRLRLGYLRNSKISSPYFVNRVFIPQTKDRIQQWLTYCYDKEEVQSIGQEIYNWLKEFERTNDRYKGKLLPETRTIRQKFDPNGKKPPREKELNEPPGGNRNDNIPNAPPTDSNLNILLPWVGAECKRKLHEVSNLLFVKEHLNQLVAGLRGQGCKESSDAIDRLLRIWGTSSNDSGEDSAKRRRRPTVSVRRSTSTRTQTPPPPLTGCDQANVDWNFAAPG